MGAGDEARKKILRRKFHDQAMEAAFDDDLRALERAFDQAAAQDCPLPIDPPPSLSPGAKGPALNSLLSEAACGGACECMEWLLAKGADPNRAGEHNRVPLTRALSNDMEAAVLLLLEAGADPRLCLPQEREAPSDEFPDGRFLFRPWDPADVCGLMCGPECKAVLAQWDINRTLSALRSKAAAADDARAKAAADREDRKAAVATTLDDLAAARHEAEAAYKAKVAQREQRILEYDTARCEGARAEDQRLVMLDGLIKESAEEVRLARVRVDELDRQLQGAGKEQRDLQRRPSAADSAGWCPDVALALAQVEDVIVADVGGAMLSSGKHAALVQDVTGDALTFLAYREVLMLDIGNSHHMQPLQLRASVLGALRFGKPLVINLRDRDVEAALGDFATRLGAAHESLPRWLEQRRLPAEYRALIDDAVVDLNPELAVKKFSTVYTERFRVCFVTEAKDAPGEDVRAKFYVVRVG